MVIVPFKMSASTLDIVSLRMERNVTAVKYCYVAISWTAVTHGQLEQ